MNKTKISTQIRRTLNLSAPPAILPAGTLVARYGISSKFEAARKAGFKLDHAIAWKRGNSRPDWAPTHDIELFTLINTTNTL
jgi:hypothetical protein